VEFAPFQKTAKKKMKRKDAKCGTIDEGKDIFFIMLYLKRERFCGVSAFFKKVFVFGFHKIITVSSLWLSRKYLVQILKLRVVLKILCTMLSYREAILPEAAPYFHLYVVYFPFRSGLQEVS